jgi:hypothetical protein
MLGVVRGYGTLILYLECFADVDPSETMQDDPRASDPLSPEEEHQKFVSVDALFKGKLLASTQQLQPNHDNLSRTAKLLDFPNEIILLILEQVELDWDLFTVASISKRLHYLALPLFFARNGVSPFAGELVLFDSCSFAVFRALSIALFRPALKRLRCTFDFAKPENIRRLRSLIENLSWIEEVYVSFTDTRSSWEPLRPVKPVEWEAVAAKELRELFGAMIEKAVRFTIYDTTTWYAESTAEEMAAVGWKWQFGRYAMQSTTLTAWNAVKTISQWWKGEPSLLPGLTFDLHSPMLLHASFLPWTIMTLNSTRLSTLSLQQLRMDHDQWAAILSPLVMPNLSNLRVDSCSISFSALMKFFSHHPQITHLYLGRSLALPSKLHSDQLPTDILPRLTHLSTTSQYLLHLLTPQTSLPSLESVSLITRITHGRYFDFRLMNDALLPILFRLKQTELSLDVSFESSSDDWMLLDVAPDQRTEVAMQYVSRIDLKIAMYRLPRDIITSLPRWFVLFPGLKCVAFWSIVSRLLGRFIAGLHG